MNLVQRIEALRNKMREQGIDYYYVPSIDQHKNEYVPDCWQRRTWISGFSGSAGDALIGLNEAYLWTDARYFLQAENELPKHFTLMKQVQGVAPVDGWLRKNAVGKTLAVDPKVVSLTQGQRLGQAMMDAQGKFVDLEENLVDAVWRDQPKLSGAPVVIYPEHYAGLSANAKIQQVRDALQNVKADAHVISMLDAIAWVYNIRGCDVAFNPLVISYALISAKEAYLFVDPAKIQDKAYFAAEGITLLPYEAFAAELQKLSGKVWVDAGSASLWLSQQLKHAQLHLEASPISLLKAVKNPTELAGMQLAHEKDAAAMIEFIQWLERNWPSQTEISASDKLAAVRKQDTDFRDLSFDTISAYASNGAIIHYRASDASAKKLDDKALYLLDSGAQYWQGTTDITRVFHFGEPLSMEKRHYTLVLKGHLALRHAIFPAGTFGENLDILARKPLWDAGLNYGHGTGHGVGCYLCVHEGPQVISPRGSGVPLLPGMIVSNEPGVYFPGQYGIRIENLVYVKVHSKTAMGEFYTFEDLTLVPHNRKLIDTDLLSAQEIEWINQYHTRVYRTLAKRVSAEAAAWLKAACADL